jgi:hypothetical protein
MLARKRGLIGLAYISLPPPRVINRYDQSSARIVQQHDATTTTTTATRRRRLT